MIMMMMAFFFSETRFPFLDVDELGWRGWVPRYFALRAQGITRYLNTGMLVGICNRKTRPVVESQRAIYFCV
jgi:hypothetical protein